MTVVTFKFRSYCNIPVVLFIMSPKLQTCLSFSKFRDAIGAKFRFQSQREW